MRGLGWIRVQDELPEYDTPVLVYIADRGTVMLTQYFNDFALVKLCMDEGFGAHHGVTHWIAVTPPHEADNEATKNQG